MRRAEEPLSEADSAMVEAALALVGPASRSRWRRSGGSPAAHAPSWWHGPRAVRAAPAGRKAIGIAALLLLLVLFLPTAMFRVSADATLEGSVQRAAAARSRGSSPAPMPAPAMWSARARCSHRSTIAT
jgi:hypothetical protein